MVSKICCIYIYDKRSSKFIFDKLIQVGYQKNKGIVPIACDEIFKRINANDDVDRKYQVQFSMLEIYNEKVQDLLANCHNKPAGGLKVRES